MKITAISGVVACLVLSPAPVARAIAAPPSRSIQTQPTAPAQPAQRPVPPRDAERKDAKGTAVLKGRVVAGESGKPLRRARVTIRAPELGSESQRTTSTNLDGRYEFKDLPAARYRVSVARSGYLGLEHGQRRPGEIGRPVQVADGQTLDRIDFAMPRMGVIAGRVTDEGGDPIEGVRIFATRLMFFEGQRKLVPIGTSSNQTDDEGEYRITRLAPGHYYVMATTKEMWSVTENGQERQVGFMPTYFPGVAMSSEARRLTVAPGQQIGSIDFALVPGRSAKLSGIAVDSQQKPFSRVQLTEEVRGLGFASFGGGPSGAVAADGTFTITNVPPGEYTISASRREGDPAGPPEVAIATVFVDGNDIENLSLTGSAGGTVRGRVIVEGETPPKMSTVIVSIRQPLRNQASPVVLGLQRSNREPGVKEDGTFVAENVFGKSRFQVTVPEGWMVKSITQDGKDISDAIIDLGSGQELSDVQVVISSRVTSVEGRLQDDKNLPIRDATVLVFDANPDKWFESTRRVRAARPDQDGQWRLKGMPAGEYLAIALDYVEDGAWNDPEYLESLRRDASTVTLAEGAVATMALKVVTPKQ